MIHQVKSLLREGCAFTVLRLDIKSFYESIDSAIVLNRIAQDSILSYTSRLLLKKLFETPQLSGQPGVPRGLGISATLAELYTRRLDRQIRSLKHVYFYGRYVDDMIIFTHANASDAEADVKTVLDALGLTLNSNKRTVVNCYGDKNKHDQSSYGFNFLGYHLDSRRYLDAKNAWRDVCIRIAPSKVKKIKSRIVHALVDYADSYNFQLLLRRMRFLAGNYVLRGTENGGLCSGIYYNYHHINDKSDLDDLDAFYRRKIFAKRGSFGRRFSHSLTDEQRQELLKIGFRSAFERRFSCRLPWGAMSELRQCWAYEKN
jgi:hypothetical protein